MSAAPYADVLGGRDPIDVARETPSRLRRLLEGISGEAANAPMAAGKWSLREVMAHLADCEIAWGWRLRQAFAEEHAQMQPFDQDAWAKMYRVYTFADAKACFFALREWNVAFLSGLSEADKRKPIVHPERGEETLWTLAQVLAGHDLHHLAALEAKLGPASREA